VVEIKKRWSASSLLVQDKAERLDDGRLARIVLSEQDIHARPELHGLVGEAPVITDMNSRQVHNVPQDNTRILYT
jgi:hypothetical protein